MLRTLLCALSLFVSCLPSLAVDREAFTFTNYDLDARLERDQQRLGVRGHITLRNDSSAPQKVAVLQISSTLNWRSIRAEDKPLQFVSQSYTSDIDHTGSLSEAIVTLPREIKPKESVEIEIGYEGTIKLDATRLTRLGTPEAKAKNSDWDQIGTTFTGVRGVGYVAWYPIAIEGVTLSQGNNVFEAVGRWKARHADSTMQITLHDGGSLKDSARLLCNGAINPSVDPTPTDKSVACNYAALGIVVPSFVGADYETVTSGVVNFFFMPSHKEAAEEYAVASELALPLINDWFGAPKNRVNVYELPDAGSAPFEAGDLMLMPLGVSDRKLARLTLVHGLTHAAFRAPRPWVNEGMAHFMQALEREQIDGRKAALDYLGLHRSAFLAASKSDEEAPRQPLTSTFDETFYRSKAMYVWWMLRDMVGEALLKNAIHKYRADEDKSPKYVEELVEAEAKTDLTWFFDDWVYQDRGLPEFRIESAFSRKTDKGSYLLTVTVTNSGMAGAEVPFTVNFNGGEIVQRLTVRGNAKATTRVEVPGLPQQVIVNDGSVPENDLTNNVFTISSP